MLCYSASPNTHIANNNSATNVGFNAFIMLSHNQDTSDLFFIHVDENGSELRRRRYRIPVEPYSAIVGHRIAHIIGKYALIKYLKKNNFTSSVISDVEKTPYDAFSYFLGVLAFMDGVGTHVSVDVMRHHQSITRYTAVPGVAGVIGDVHITGDLDIDNSYQVHGAGYNVHEQYSS